MTPYEDAYAEYHYREETPKAPPFELPTLPVAPFIHGPSPTFISPSTSISSDEDSTGDRGEHPFFSDAEMGLIKPVRDPVAEQRANPRFPSPFDFDTIIYEYLSGLSQKKREKALLNRTMYQAVLYVHHAPKDTAFKTAQFRFWAKKMFSTTQYSGEEVLTHDHKPVAVREQIYEVLIHCHTQAAHGGRDKTSIQVRKYYSWIPKDIIAKFVSKCPSCQSKRTITGPAVGTLTKSQEYFMALQQTEQDLNSKKPISLHAARVAAHQAGRRHAAKTQREQDQQAQRAAIGRVHTVGGSSVLPQNAVHYDTSYIPHQAQQLQQPQNFGQSNYFQPPAQPPIGALPRSTSFDGSAARQQYIHMQNQSVEMNRRVSDSGVGRYVVHGVEATPRASQVLRQNQQRSIVPYTHMTGQTHLMPLPEHQQIQPEVDTLEDVRAGCKAYAEEQLLAQDQITSSFPVPMQPQQITQDQIDPTLNQQCAEFFQESQAAQAASANLNQAHRYDVNMIGHMGSHNTFHADNFGFNQPNNTQFYGPSTDYVDLNIDLPAALDIAPLSEYPGFDMSGYSDIQPIASGSGSGSNLYDANGPLTLPSEDQIDFGQFLHMDGEDDPCKQYLHSDPAEEFEALTIKSTSGTATASGSGTQGDLTTA